MNSSRVLGSILNSCVLIVFILFPEIIQSYNRGLNDRPLAMAYVPYQEFEDLYADDEALYNGTLFRKLNLPFVGRRNGK